MTQLVISPEAGEAIRILIASLEGPGPFGLYETARRINALPVYTDMGGSLFVTPEGEILGLDGDQTSPQIEIDPGWRITARVSAADKYPQLRSLLPIRPSGVADCPGCKGSGKLQVSEMVFGCGDCRGLGWRC